MWIKNGTDAGTLLVYDKTEPTMGSRGNTAVIIGSILVGDQIVDAVQMRVVS